MVKKSFAVIGMGRFGEALTEELVKLSADVLVIDKSYEKIEKIAKTVSNAVSLDATDVEALKEVGITNYDTVIVSTGENVDNSILTTLILKDLGIKEIYVKVQSEYHAKVIEKLGVPEEHMIWPEMWTGKRYANILVSGKFLDYVELDKDHSFVSVEVSDKLVGQNLLELDIRSRFNVNIVAVKRDDKIMIPTSKTPFEENDLILYIGHNDSIQKFTNWLKK